MALLSKGPEYREPVSFCLKHYSTLIMDSVEDYARRWANKNEVVVDTLAEWVKSIASLVNKRICI